MITPKIQTLADWAVADQLLAEANADYAEDGEIETAISRIKAVNILMDDIGYELAEQAKAQR